MRVRGILTCLALSAALSAVGPSAQAASKPRPTPPPTLKTLKKHQTCTKTAAEGAKLCLRVELKQTAATRKQMTYMTLAGYETRLARGLAIAFVAKTVAGKDMVIGGCTLNIGACGSVFLTPEKYTQVRAQLQDKSHKAVLSTSAIHLPLR